MDALELLTTRSSMPRLVEPAPTPQQLDMIRKAAIRVPDHMILSPFKFVEFLGSERGLF